MFWASRMDIIFTFEGREEEPSRQGTAFAVFKDHFQFLLFEEYRIHKILREAQLEMEKKYQKKEKILQQFAN